MDFHESVTATIKQHGCQLIGVKSDPAFIYTIGNHGRGLPELLVVGANDSGVGELLNLLVDIMRKNKRPFTDGELVSLGGGKPVKVIDANSQALNEYAIQAREYYRGRGDTVRVQQVLLPDKAGHYPDDPRCVPPYSLQPILKPAM